MEDIVSQDHADAVIADEFLADDEGLREAVRRRLLGVCEADAVVRAVAQQAPEGREVCRSRDDQNVPDAGLHEDGDGILDHRLVEDREQLLADSFGDRIEACAASSSQYDSFHVVV